MKSEFNFRSRTSDIRTSDTSITDSIISGSSTDEMEKRKILKEIGGFLFKQGLINIEEKKKFDENIRQ